MLRNITSNQYALVTASGKPITFDFTPRYGEPYKAFILMYEYNIETGENPSISNVSQLPSSWQQVEGEQITPTTHAFEFAYDGQSIIIDYKVPGDSESGTVMTPVITEIYQP